MFALRKNKTLTPLNEWKNPFSASHKRNQRKDGKFNTITMTVDEEQVRKGLRDGIFRYYYFHQTVLVDINCTFKKVLKQKRVQGMEMFFEIFLLLEFNFFTF